jgi:ribose transport system substrate-binding protein
MVGPFISQAVGAHASAIVVEGIPTGSITQPLADAKTAGIPVIKILDNVPQLPTTSSYAGEVTYCYACIARLEADWTIANGHGNVNTVTYWNIGTASGPFINSAMKAEYARLCPATCHISLESLLISNWATDLPTMTASDLIHQPAYNYFAPSYSDMLTLMAPSAKSSKAAAISFGVDTPTLTLLKKKDFAKALVGASATWTGWAVADQTLRILVGKSPVANENIPIRLFDSANIGTINVSAPEASWFGVNFQADYLKLWKIS